MNGTNTAGPAACPKNRNERRNDRAPPRLSGMIVAPSAWKTTTMKAAAAPPTIQISPSAHPLLPSATAIDDAVAASIAGVAIRRGLWRSSSQPQTGPATIADTAPPNRMMPVVVPLRSRTSLAETPTRTASPTGPAAAKKNAAPSTSIWGVRSGRSCGADIPGRGSPSGGMNANAVAATAVPMKAVLQSVSAAKPPASGPSPAPTAWKLE